MGDTIQIEIELLGLAEHGQRCRVMYAGEILVEGRRNPIYDACGALLVRGITGRLEVWRRGKKSADMQLDIEKGAGLAVWESEKTQPANSGLAARFPDAVSSRGAAADGH